MRNRNNYGNEALLVGPTGGGAVGNQLQLHRVTSINRGFTYNRQDVVQFSQLQSIDRVVTEPPIVNLSFEYLATNALNESRMGFVVNNTASAISGFITTGTSNQNNYYILKSPEGVDAVSSNSDALDAVLNFVEGIGNGFISNYRAFGSVGDFARAEVTVEGLNWRAYASASGQVCPSVDPVNGADVTANTFILPDIVSGLAGQATAIGQGDITVTISGTLGVLASDLKIQSYELSVPLSRTPQQKLGSKFPFFRHVDFPINSTMSIAAEVGDMATGSVSAMLCNDPSVNCRVTLKTPSCDNSGPGLIYYEIRGAKLDSENFSSALGGNETVNITWSAPMGNSSDLSRGIFISGQLT